MNDVPELSAPDPPEQNEFHVSVYHWWGIYIYIDELERSFGRAGRD